MELIRLYECLCDPTRLRLLNVLARGPLCVCHFQAVLGLPQVTISKHLAYLRTRGLVRVTRRGRWMIYALPARPSRELRANLACLQDCAQEHLPFRRDLVRLRQLSPMLAKAGTGCCGAGQGSAVRPRTSGAAPARRPRLAQQQKISAST